MGRKESNKQTNPSPHVPYDECRKIFTRPYMILLILHQIVTDSFLFLQHRPQFFYFLKAIFTRPVGRADKKVNIVKENYHMASGPVEFSSPAFPACCSFVPFLMCIDSLFCKQGAV